VLDAREPEPRRKLYAEAADQLSLHLFAEEQLFYPALKRLCAAEAPAAAHDEHQSMRQLMSDLLRLSPLDAAFEPAFRALGEHLRRHYQEEEESLFPAVCRLMDAGRREELGCDMIALQTRMKLEGRPRDAMSASSASD
jgi:iron-sulfur cluster repair protein YtfE (RIC family)